MKRAVYLAVALLMVTLTAFAAAEVRAQKALTLMVYMTGSDLESDYGAATSDIQEMAFSGVNLRKVNVVLMTGGSGYRNNDQSIDVKKPAIPIVKPHRKRLSKMISRRAIMASENSTAPTCG